MLAFTRRLDESFIIGEDIVVKVLGRDDQGNIQFGIEVPESASIRYERTDGEIKSDAVDIPDY